MKNTEIAARLRRVERKCGRILREMALLRVALAPRESEIDEVIERLRLAAERMRERSAEERESHGKEGRQ